MPLNPYLAEGIHSPHPLPLASWTTIETSDEPFIISDELISVVKRILKMRRLSILSAPLIPVRTVLPASHEFVTQDMRQDFPQSKQELDRSLCPSSCASLLFSGQHLSQSEALLTQASDVMCAAVYWGSA